MNLNLKWTLLAALVLLLAAPDVQAQSTVVDRVRERVQEAQRERQQTERDRRPETQNRGTQGKANRDREVRDHRRGDVYDVRRDDRSHQGAKKGVPAFCRSGAGHPVHGVQWCYDRGHMSGSRHGGIVWERGSLGNVVFHQEARRGTLNERELRAAIGSRTVDRAAAHARRSGANDALTGHWLDAHTLELRAGATPVARLTDENRNRRVDETLLAHHRQR